MRRPAFLLSALIPWPEQNFPVSFSLADMFVNASYLITPTGRSDRAHVDILRKLAYDIGFKTVIEATPSVTMKVSPIPLSWPTWFQIHISKSPTLSKERGFSAGSFLDMTRVARLDEDTWCDLFLLNKENLLQEIDALLKHISQHKEALEAGDRERIRELLKKDAF